MVKISVVIQIHNEEHCLEKCIRSVLDQSIKEIELICVDNGSTDSSYQILQTISAKEPRLNIYHFDRYQRTLSAWKKGILACSGEYIMFLQVEDYLEQAAGQKLYQKVKEENVDILHFGSVIENPVHLPEKNILTVQKSSAPYEGRICHGEVFSACFLENKFHSEMWNKIFRSELCKRACHYMEDLCISEAEDFYAFFIISFFADSYCGWNDKMLHHCCLAEDGAVQGNMTPAELERSCSRSIVYSELENFCRKFDILPVCEGFLQKQYKIWIQECIRQWMHELPNQYGTEGMEILYRYWGPEKTVQYLANAQWYNRTAVSSKLQGFMPHSLKNRKICTVAFYYYHMNIGGVQRVISLLTKMLIEMGYRVVVITDEPASGMDFSLPEGVKRLLISNWRQANRDNIQSRLRDWADLIRENQIDVVLYNAWTSNVLLWDLMYLKGLNIPVVVHCHNVFSYAMNKLDGMMVETCNVLSLADGLVVLSKADQLYWSVFQRNAHFIFNPVSSQLLHVTPGIFANKAIVWVGRCSNEKQPWQALNIFKDVLARVPDAMLYMVGDFSDPKWDKMAKDKGISANVIFTGATLDVNSFYEKASVYLSTSMYEGFPMTLLEAQAHALPIVAFNMPNLTLSEPGRGVFTVEQNNCKEAAFKIIQLLEDEGYWEDASRQALESIQNIEEYDLKAAWKRLLDGELPKEPAPPYAVKAMLRTILTHYYQGVLFQRRQREQEAASAKALHQAESAAK